MLVLRELWVFVSSLDVFLQVFMCACSMVGEDMYCDSPVAIAADFEERLALQGDLSKKEEYSRLAAGVSAVDLPPLLDFKSVLPGGQLPRIDAHEWNYAQQRAARGEEQAVHGRPVWDLHQNVLKESREDPYVPTVLPASTLFSSRKQRPATCDEHLLCQGLVFETGDPSWKKHIWTRPVPLPKPGGPGRPAPCNLVPSKLLGPLCL